MKFFIKLHAFSKSVWAHKISIIAGSSVITITGFKAWRNRSSQESNNSPQCIYWAEESRKEIAIESIPNRRQQIDCLRKHAKSSSNNYRYYNHTYRLLLEETEGENQNTDKYEEFENESEYDLIVIGGGATGCGIALDAITRGLNVALVEKNDFASGTSSRSTKLIHGGVRYLEKAVKELDLDQWNLVKEAITERTHLIKISPHLSYPIPIIIPIYNESFVMGWLQLIRIYFGLKLYEALAGKDGLLCPTYYLSPAHAKSVFKQLKQPNMIGNVVYYDGTHNDSRMCLSIALTAAAHGATIANHVEVIDLIKEDTTNDHHDDHDNDDDNIDSIEEKIIGVRLRDNLTGIEWNTFAKTVINASGCFVDSVRMMNNPYCDQLIIPSQGTHIILPGSFSPQQGFGMLIPHTDDGRVAFVLPFENVTIAGTTDKKLDKVTDLPCPTEIEIQEILHEINQYMDTAVDISDVDAAWAGIRPLAQIPKEGYINKVMFGTVSCIQPLDGYWKEQKKNQWLMNRQMFVDSMEKRRKEYLLQSKSVHIDDDDDDNDNDDEHINKRENCGNISRHHLIEVTKSGLLTITGGKWTTYRKMAEDSLNILCDMHPEFGHRTTECVSKVVQLIGGSKWTHSVPAILKRHQIEDEIAEHLSKNYGDKSFIVGNLYLNKFNKRLAGGYPYTEAEVVYCSQYEMAQTAIDILCRRTRLAQLNRAAAEYSLPSVIKLMGEVHDWDSRTRVAQFHDSMTFLRTMHVKDRHKWGRSRHTLDYSRRVVESVLNGPSMTDAAIEFVIDRFWDYHSQNERNNDEGEQHLELYQTQDNNIYNRQEMKDTTKKHQQSRKLFEGCISREQTFQLAEEFCHVFGDDSVIDALMFTGLQEFGLYEILVSCAACAANPEQFDPPGPWIAI